MSYQFGMRTSGIETRNDAITLPYRLIGETDPSTARAYVLASTPLLFSAYYRKDARMAYQGAGVWDADVEYATKDKKESAAYDCKWTFDTGGKTKKMTQGIKHIATYKPSTIAAAIDHHGAIGVTDDAVEGVEVPDKAYKWTEVWQLPAERFGFTYSTVLGELNGSMNTTYFRGFPAHTVQFQGGQGGDQSGDGKLRQFSFSFEVSPSETGLSIGDITGIAKEGWDYLWVRYESTDDDAAKKTTPKPIQVEVDRVVREFNFGLLGLGTGILQ